MDVFGDTDPKKMPPHFFFGANFLEYDTAIQGDWRKQNITVAPRHWYIDAEYECPICKRLFIWTAKEQRRWFEDYRLYVDAEPQSCRSCRQDHKRMQALRKEYDAILAEAEKGDLKSRARVVEIIGLLGDHLDPMPEGMVQKSKWFERSLAREEDDGGD